MKNLLTPTILILALFFSTYIVFAAYQPKILREIVEVKGVKTSTLASDLLNLPQPEDATRISTTDTKDTYVLTFETQKSPSGILTFYKNILLENDWRLKKDGPNTTEYKKDKLYVTVNALAQESNKNTVVMLEIQKIEN
ncbi:hypothetical protein ACFL13_01945 [Patescibacteria group bacterium]